MISPTAQLTWSGARRSGLSDLSRRRAASSASDKPERITYAAPLANIARNGFGWNVPLAVLAPFCVELLVLDALELGGPEFDELACEFGLSPLGTCSITPVKLDAAIGII